MKRVDLQSGWTFSGREWKDLPAGVPGCVHTDLRSAGLIPDLFRRDTNRDYQWIEDCGWTYCCRFDAEPGRPAVLVFEGLDTYCDIFLNGERLGSAEDMFIPYRFDVTGRLSVKGNRLEVRFFPPARMVEGKPARSAAFTSERLYTRRIQCTYGWDWVDRFVTCGIWRPVYLLYGNDIYAESAYICTESADRFGAQISVELNFANSGSGGIAKIGILSPQGETAAGTELYVREPTAVCRFDLRDPQLWYPNGLGDHPIYTLKVSVGGNVFTETFGIRTVRILQLPDEPGSEYEQKARRMQAGVIGRANDRNTVTGGFQVVVNGRPVFCQGANWVPSEPFPSAETGERFAALVRLAAGMNVNMLRVWGGGIFEDPRFYAECDRAGILVQQDFLMACGSYPEKEEWFLEALRRESSHAARLLRNHPCLIWWNGDNENAVNGSDVQPDYTGRDSALKGIAESLRREDPRRVFLRSSPYGGDPYASITRGTTHMTNFLGEMFRYFEESDCSDYLAYFENFTARFISEEPTFGASDVSSLLRFLSESDLSDESEAMIRYHTKTNPCLEREIFDYVRCFAEKLLGGFRDTEDRLFKYRYVQYEWLRARLESCRRNLGYCSGVIFWMFDDCWPSALGWSLIDHDGRPKAAAYAFRRCSKRISVSLIRRGEICCAALSNDSEAQNVTGTAYLLDLTQGGTILRTYSFETSVREYSVGTVDLPWKCGDGEMIVCDVKWDGGTDRSFLKNGLLHLEPADDSLRVAERGTDSITLRADKYIHCVELTGDCVFDDNYFSLLPGETRRISVSWQRKRCIFAARTVEC